MLFSDLHILRARIFLSSFIPSPSILTVHYVLFAQAYDHYELTPAEVERKGGGGRGYGFWTGISLTTLQACFTARKVIGGRKGLR